MAKSSGQGGAPQGKRGAQSRRGPENRRQRVEQMRKQQRHSELKRTALFTAAGVVVGGAIIAGTLPTLLAKGPRDVGYVTTPTAAEKAAGCTGVRTDPASPGNLHTTDPIDYSKSPWTQDPPSSGRHNPVSLGDTNRFYPLSEHPRPERAVHNLEHGYVVVWYDTALPAKQVDQLKSLATDASLPRLLVVGWDRGQLPQNKHVVLTSWGRTERCSTVSRPVISAFYQQHHDAPFAPETTAGPITGADQLAPSLLKPTASPSPSTSGNPGASPSTTTTRGTTTSPSATTSGGSPVP